MARCDLMIAAPNHNSSLNSYYPRIRRGNAFDASQFVCLSLCSVRALIFESFD